MNILPFDQQVAIISALTEGCRTHETTRTTPAVALDIADHAWSIAELVETALSDADRPEPGAHYRPFTVIDGGRS